MKLIAWHFVNTQGTPQKVNTGNGQDQSLRDGVPIVWPQGHACLGRTISTGCLWSRHSQHWTVGGLTLPSEAHTSWCIYALPHDITSRLHTTSKITSYISIAHAYTKWPLFLSILFLLLPLPLKTLPSGDAHPTHPTTLRTNNSEHALYSDER